MNNLVNKRFTLGLRHGLPVESALDSHGAGALLTVL